MVNSGYLVLGKCSLMAGQDKKQTTNIEMKALLIFGIRYGKISMTFFPTLIQTVTQLAIQHFSFRFEASEIYLNLSCWLDTSQRSGCKSQKLRSSNNYIIINSLTSPRFTFIAYWRRGREEGWNEGSKEEEREAGTAILTPTSKASLSISRL